MLSTRYDFLFKFPIKLHLGIQIWNNLDSFIQFLHLPNISLHLLPSGNLTVCYGKWTKIVGDLPIQIVIFQFAMLVVIARGYVAEFH